MVDVYDPELLMKRVRRIELKHSGPDQKPEEEFLVHFFKPSPSECAQKFEPTKVGGYQR